MQRMAGVIGLNAVVFIKNLFRFLSRSLAGGRDLKECHKRTARPPLGGLRRPE